jgi:hypothetical protein
MFATILVILLTVCVLAPFYGVDTRTPELMRQR